MGNLEQLNTLFTAWAETVHHRRELSTITPPLPTSAESGRRRSNSGCGDRSSQVLESHARRSHLKVAVQSGLHQIGASQRARTQRAVGHVIDLGECPTHIPNLRRAPAGRSAHSCPRRVQGRPSSDQSGLRLVSASYQHPFLVAYRFAKQMPGRFCRRPQVAASGRTGFSCISGGGWGLVVTGLPSQAPPSTGQEFAARPTRH